MPKERAFDIDTAFDWKLTELKQKTKNDGVRSTMKAGDAIETKRADWSFGGNVAENFISHVSRSVPGYEEGHNIVCRQVTFFA